MAAGYVRQSTANIQPNLEINAGDHNAEYDEIAAAFDNTTGHDHSGGATGVGAKISMTASVTGTLPIANGGTGLATIGTSGQVPISNGSALVYGNVGTSFSIPGGTPSTASLVGVHAGTGVTHALSKTTRIMITIYGVVSNNANGCGGAVSIRYGTGAAPAGGAALTGSATGGVPYCVNPAAGPNTITFPISVSSFVTGLTIGTTYWIDAAITAVTGGTASYASLAVMVVEI